MICIHTCVSSRYCDLDCELSQAEYIAGIWPCSCFFSLIFSFCFSESFRLLKLIGDSTATKSESSFFETNVEEIGFEPRRPDLNSKFENWHFFADIFRLTKIAQITKERYVIFRLFSTSLFNYEIIEKCMDVNLRKEFILYFIYARRALVGLYTLIFFCTTTQGAAKIRNNQAKQKMTGSQALT